MASTSPAFQTAVADSKKLTSKPSNDDLLEIYALFKVANGEDFSKATAPGMIYHEANSHLFFPRLQAKAKYNAWKKVALEDGLTAEEAQDKYVKKIEEMKEKYGYDANKEPEAVGGN
ncbi:acyl-CoA-binding protein [Cladorrhinum samala]|uniref:Acyl-CoA-binding protein n=1 Tax=Cladorrhinum samala TaxID=585594 RepID=A0AAV9HPF6_9PEZI|nr:acyl-CoA-binding protein [Cladorrhinum samala]